MKYDRYSDQLLVNATGSKDNKQRSLEHFIKYVSIKRRLQDFWCITPDENVLKLLMPHFYLYLKTWLYVFLWLTWDLNTLICIFVLLNFGLFFLWGWPDHMSWDLGLLKDFLLSWALPIPVSAFSLIVGASQACLLVNCCQKNRNCSELYRSS